MTPCILRRANPPCPRFDMSSFLASQTPGPAKSIPSADQSRPKSFNELGTAPSCQRQRARTAPGRGTAAVQHLATECAVSGFALIDGWISCKAGFALEAPGGAVDRMLRVWPAGVKKARVTVGGYDVRNPEKIRAQARDYAAQATATDDLHEAVRLRQLAKSYLLLEKNARWLLSTDEFLDALRANRRWPHPPHSSRT